MAASIAKASIALSVSGAGVAPGLSRAEKGLGDFTKKARDVMDKGGKDAAVAFRDQISGLLKGSVIAASLSSLAGQIKGAISSALSGLSGIFTDTQSKFKELLGFSLDLGVDLSAFKALADSARIAGIETKDLHKALTELGLAMVKRNEESTFAQLGLEIEALRNMPIDEAFLKITGALNSIEDPVKRNALLIRLFGSEAAKILPFLNKGEEAIRKMIQESKQFGDLNPDRAGKLKQAAESLQKLQNSWEDLKQSLSIIAAPGISILSEYFKDITNSITDTTNQAPIFKTFVQAIVGGVIGMTETLKLATAGLLEASAAVLDFAQSMETAFKPVRNFTTGLKVVTSIAAPALLFPRRQKPFSELSEEEQQDKVIKGFDKSFPTQNFDSGKSTQDVLRERSQQLRNSVSGILGDLPDYVKKAFEAFDKEVEKRAKEIDVKNNLDGAKRDINQQLGDTLKGIEQQIKTIGFTPLKLELFKFENRTDVPKEKIAELRKEVEKFRNVELGFKNVEEFFPEEAFRNSIQGLDELKNAGRITLEQYQQGVLNATKGLESAVGGGLTRAANAEFFGSREAAQTRIQAQLQQRQASPTEVLQRSLKEAARQREAQLKKADELISVIKEGQQKEPLFEVFDE